MISSLLSLALVSFAAAAPASRRGASVLPDSTSKGFKLIANVTGETPDFYPSINGWPLTAYHSGAGQNFATLSNPSTYGGNIFYENGTTGIDTAADPLRNVITDLGVPASPYAISVQNRTSFSYNHPGEHDAYISVGSGTRGIELSEGIPLLKAPDSVAYWAACNNTLIYGASAIAVQPLYPSIEVVDGEITVNKHVPEGCVVITLLAQCAQLNELAEGSYSSHEFALEEKCYTDVKAIKWPGA